MSAARSPAAAAEPFRINGASVMHDEPYPYLDQAHALALLCAMAFDDEENGPPSETITSAAFRGISSLIELAAMGTAAMVDSMNGGRHGAA